MKMGIHEIDIPVKLRMTIKIIAYYIIICVSLECRIKIFYLSWD